MDERLVGGLRCSQVLAVLSSYVDGELPLAERAQVDEHLRGCDGCARFGGEFNATLQALREHLLGAPCDEARLRRRLADALRAPGR